MCHLKKGKPKAKNSVVYFIAYMSHPSSLSKHEDRHMV